MGNDRKEMKKQNNSFFIQIIKSAPQLEAFFLL
jgi:hypothetical protein